MTGRTTLRFEVCGRCLALETGDPALAESLGCLFPGCGDSSPGSLAHPAQYRVAQDEHGYVFTSADGTSARHEGLIDLAVAVEFALAEAFLHEHREQTQVHAGGVVTHRGAVLFLGRAGAGKSSLTFTWCRRGAPALADDVVLLDAQGQANAFKRLFKLDPVLLEESGIPLGSTPMWEPESSAAWWDPASAAGWAEPAPVRALVIVRFEAGGRTELRDVPRRDALNALAHSLMPTGLNRTASFRTLARVVEDAEPFELRFGSSPEAVETLARHLG